MPLSTLSAFHSAKLRTGDSKGSPPVYTVAYFYLTNVLRVSVLIEFIKQHGADAVLDYQTIDFQNQDTVFDQVRDSLVDQKIPNSDKFQGFDLIYDCVTSPEDFSYREVSTQKLLSENGHYFCINGSKGLWAKAIMTTATGLGWFLPKNQDLYLPSVSGEKCDRMSQWMAEGKLDVQVCLEIDWKTGKKVGEEGKSWVGDRVSLDLAVEEQCSRRARGKIVITNVGSSN